MLRRGVGPDPRRARARLAAPWANPGRGWTYQKAPPKEEAQPGGQEKKEEKKEEIKAEPIDVSDVTNIVRNDYNQSFVDLGIRPQNHLRDADPATRYIEYPKLERVVQLKNEILKVRNTPAMYLQCDMKTFDFSTLGTDFDVVLMDPPWEEYAQRCEQTHVTCEDLTPWSMAELEEIPMNKIAKPTAFLFLWCGVKHLEDARALFRKWGFRRVEDVCWLKTNHSKAKTLGTHASLIQRVTEHCLMGIRGGVKRSSDTHMVHSNIDTDIIIDEEPEEVGSTRKPDELYDIIEHFCLARQRIELFGRDHNIRPGWVTVGKEITKSNYDGELYKSWFHGDLCYPEVTTHVGGRFVGTSPEIEETRPRSPGADRRRD
jgi:mRNA (2'-O-methyladenosine-N6-)-methyltransferase